jgi:pyrroloquinoline-quinone synthase
MTLRDRMDEAVGEHHLLKHPFYQAWTAGTLPREALQHYSRQYFHQVQAFPTYVSAAHAACVADLPARQELLENLIEEERGEHNHAALWLDFAEGLGLKREAVSAGIPEAAVQELVACFRKLTSAEAGSAVAALYAYESQIPAVAEAKIAGLRERYGITAARALAFFEVHRELDKHHSATTAAIVERLAVDPEAAVAASANAAKALWKFLDAMPC